MNLLSLWLSSAALITVYLGFAGMLGALAYQARAGNYAQPYWAGLVFGGAVFIPASLAFPVPPYLRGLAWGGAILFGMIYALRPARLPDWSAASL